MADITQVISHIWQVIVESNTFNFVIFLALFYLIFKKINLKGMLDSLQQKIIEAVESAKSAKEEAHSILKNSEKAIAHLDEELKEIISDASNTASVLGNKVLEDAKKQVSHIEQNVYKVVDAESKMLISKLTHSTSKASLEVAKTHVKSALAQNPGLHDKYINESIDALDRLNF